MILTENRQNKIQVKEEFIKKIEDVIDYALKAEQMNTEYEVSVIFVDNNYIREINNEFRNIDKETDVLSFPMLEYPDGCIYREIYLNKTLEDSYYDEGKLVLGDIALSLEKAMEQSKDYGHSFEREAAYLTVHSVLHLLGYDHIEDEEKIKMRRREEQILGGLNIIR